MTIVETIKSATNKKDELGKKKIELMKPFQHGVLLDLVYIIAVGFLQLVVLPTILPSIIIVDLLTPFLLLGFISLSFKRNIVLVLLAGMLIETHSAAPLGMYITAYFIASVVITVSRKHILWYSLSPWKFIFICGQTWLFAWEFFVTFGIKEVIFFDLYYFVSQFIRIFCAMFVGMWMLRIFHCKPYLKDFGL